MSYVIPSPHAAPLMATTVQAKELTLKMESVVIANTPVFILNVVFRLLNLQ